MNTVGHSRYAVRMAADSLRAEIIKLATLPTFRLTVLGTWAAAVALGVAFASAAIHGQTGTTSALDVGLDPVDQTLAGFIILGIAAATSEYNGGQIRTSLVSVPRRMQLQASKVIALVLVTVPVAICDVIFGVGAARGVLGRFADLSDLSRAAQAVAGAVAYLTLTALISFAIATVMRRTLPAVATLLSYYFIVGPVVRDYTALSIYLPDTAGRSMWFPGYSGTDGALNVMQGSAVVVLWTLVAMTIAMMSFRCRDA